jgi:thiamine biosynthesis lipoprotein
VELYRSAFRAMGSPCELQLYADEPAAAADWLARARAEVERLERKYTRYRDDSVTAEINRSAGSASGVIVDEETASLLDYAETAHRESDGLFDITSGVLRRAWDFRSGRVPEQREIDAALSRVGWQRVRWGRPRLVLPLSGMQIDFGGFVKEYAADRAASLCRRMGARHGLVDLGGDLTVVGPHPGGAPWRVGIRDPEDAGRALRTLAVHAGGVATSGDYARCMVVDGVRYSHLLDPRSGRPVSGPRSVSVLASHCLIAGTTSTVAMLSGGDAGRWLDAVGLPCVRVERDGRVFERWELLPSARLAG